MARTISFQQVMIIPTLTTLGFGSLLFAQGVSLPSPVNAAPLPQQAMPAPAAAAPIKLAAASPAPAQPLNNPEFGTRATMPLEASTIHATTKTDLVRLARENSGREDPFVALINPAPDVVQPLPIVPTLKTIKIIPRTPLFRTHVPTFINNQGNAEVVIDPPERGDEPARGPLIVPRWSVAGILNTGREQVVLLEMNGTSREAKLGEVLEDGSRLVKITSTKIVLMMNGRRFPKQIGGTDTANE
jgi:hypothetical protein